MKLIGNDWSHAKLYIKHFIEFKKILKKSLNFF